MNHRTFPTVPPTTVGRQSANIPPRIKCKNCEKFKAPDQYSKNELTKLASAGRIDPNKSGIRCRMCTGNQQAELKCAGPCGEIKKLDGFSKNARKAGGSMWCLSCTFWKESAENDVPLEAPPTGTVNPIFDPDDQDSDVEIPGSSYDSDPEGGADEDWEDPDHHKPTPSIISSISKASKPNLKERSPGIIHLPYNQLQALQLNDNSTSGSAAPLAGYLSGNSASSRMTADDNLEHLSQSSASNVFETASSSGTATQAGHPVHYTAYDSKGIGHARVTYSSGPSNNAGNDQRDNTAPCAPVAPVSSNGWAKPAGKRNAARTYEAEPPVLQPRSVTGQYRYDSDSDEDLM